MAGFYQPEGIPAALTGLLVIVVAVVYCAVWIGIAWAAVWWAVTLWFVTIPLAAVVYGGYVWLLKSVERTKGN